ncbi:dihydromonapterin reductase [Aliikangiella marina]|uniref:Dihydromonapterin reductase n=1 Tax=Aliikangiella marina TaxID=1712262 RepID=A0A545T7F9_9GAMM|nr:dihydromonapterin reductase [Aliikangiella marina]TQV73164.1 dihydromonapterin reductase [Aliikangiella marina]
MNNPVLITGVGKRIGYQLAKHFLENDVPVIGTYRSHYDTIDELTQMGAKLFQVDFYVTAKVDEFCESVKSQFDHLRAIIHNASDWIPEKVERPNDEIFDKMMTIHGKIPYQLNLAFADLLSNTTDDMADIIHFTDYVAQTGSKKHIAYAASKAALENLTLSFATLLSPKIKVNSIAPALIKFNPGDDEAYKQKAVNKALLPREGGYSEVIDTVDYIMRSQYVTGRCFALDGGRHLK